MKQIRECLDRAFENKVPFNRKWRSIIEDDKLILVHYHHLVLVFDLIDKNILHSWWEKPADKRGLDSALRYLEERQLMNGHVYVKRCDR